MEKETEFIRNALRQKIEEIRLREAMTKIAQLKGTSKRKVTREEYERVRRTLRL